MSFSQKLSANKRKSLVGCSLCGRWHALLSKSCAAGALHEGGELGGASTGEPQRSSQGPESCREKSLECGADCQLVCSCRRPDTLQRGFHHAKGV